MGAASKFLPEAGVAKKLYGSATLIGTVADTKTPISTGI
jgi:hypothetical protein